ncbi:MAG: acyl-CoA dehydrogenase family protein [Desulfobacterales bacterium]|nr:acyl-CoA dehydrogenase family protein [Desulfobacterales bacterium]
MWTPIFPAAVVREIEEKDEFPHDLVKKFCDLGLAKVNIPRGIRRHGWRYRGPDDPL